MPFRKRNLDKFRNFAEELKKWEKEGVCERCIKIITSRPTVYYRFPKLSVFKRWEKEKRIGRKIRRPRGRTSRKTLSWEFITDIWIEEDFIHCERNKNGNCLEKVLAITGGEAMYIPAKYLREKMEKEIYEKWTYEGYGKPLLGWMYGCSLVSIWNIVKREKEKRKLAMKEDH
jgi:hypothetical protein